MRTICRSVRMRGRGMFSRAPVELRIRPARPGAGISFGHGVEARFDRARVGRRCIVLAGGGRRVSAVEHLLAACQGLGVTDVDFDCPDGEPPFGDGSSLPFVRALVRAGLREAGIRAGLVVREPVLVQGGGGWALALPGKGLRVTCVTDFPWTGPEAFDWAADPGMFERTLARARTVARTSESPAGVRRALGLRFELQQRGDFVVPARPRMPGETCRHKLLDLLGELALLGRPLEARLFVFRPGHRLNLALVRQLDRQERRDDEAG